MGNPFTDGTTVTAVKPNRYEASIHEAWNLRPLPQGGIVTALALRAMTDALDHPDQRLRTLHTTFVAQVAAGPVTIDVELLRQGRSMSHLRAEVMNAGNHIGHVTTAVFGSTRPGFAFTDLEPPAGVPRPDGCPSFRDPPPDGFEFDFEPMPFWEELVEGRPALGHPPWEEYEPDRAERAVWYRFDDPPFLDDGTLDHWRWSCWPTRCRRRRREDRPHRALVVRAERRPHRAPARRLPLAVGAGPQPRPLRRRRVRLGRHGAVGLRSRRRRRTPLDRLRHPALPVLLRRPRSDQIASGNCSFQIAPKRSRQ